MSIISITIPKGGSGKTTTAINLAAGLRELVPYVKNFMESKDLSVNYDNRELANYHTPRLNNFLNNFFDSIESVNGIIELEEINGFGNHYKHLISNKGILI